MAGVYEVVHKATGKSYVGESGDPEKRWDCGANVRGQCNNAVPCHRCSAARGSSLPLHNDMRVYGVEAFEWRLLERCKPWQLKDRELFHIAQRVNRKVPTYNLKGVRRHRDPSLFNGKDVSNPYVSDRPRKACKPYRRFTPEELLQLPVLREWGHTMAAIARLYGCTAQAVGKALQRLASAES